LQNLNTVPRSINTQHFKTVGLY